MADTPRTEAALATLFADNTAGGITPQNLRDFLASIMGVSAGTPVDAIKGTTVWMPAIATPSAPALNSGNMFTRLSGNNIQLVFQSATGDECIVCSLVNVAHTNKLTSNWIE